MDKSSFADFNIVKMFHGMEDVLEKIRASHHKAILIIVHGQLNNSKEAPGNVTPIDPGKLRIMHAHFSLR
jgi:hypothetical protein